MPSGRTLTVQPGAIVHGNAWWHSINVQGNRQAIGTAEEPILFSAVTPSVGNWTGIAVATGATASPPSASERPSDKARPLPRLTRRSTISNRKFGAAAPRALALARPKINKMRTPATWRADLGSAQPVPPWRFSTPQGPYARCRRLSPGHLLGFRSAFRV